MQSKRTFKVPHRKFIYCSTHTTQTAKLLQECANLIHCVNEVRVPVGLYLADEEKWLNRDKIRNSSLKLGGVLHSALQITARLYVCSHNNASQTIVWFPLTSIYSSIVTSALTSCPSGGFVKWAQRIDLRMQRVWRCLRNESKKNGKRKRRMKNWENEV